MLGCSLQAAGRYHRSKSTRRCTVATLVWWGTLAVILAALLCVSCLFFLFFSPWITMAAHRVRVSNDLANAARLHIAAITDDALHPDHNFTHCNH
jgi:hypothetical protein